MYFQWPLGTLRIFPSFPWSFVYKMHNTGVINPCIMLKTKLFQHNYLHHPYFAKQDYQSKLLLTTVHHSLVRNLNNLWCICLKLFCYQWLSSTVTKITGLLPYYITDDISNTVRHHADHIKARENGHDDIQGCKHDDTNWDYVNSDSSQLTELIVDSNITESTRCQSTCIRKTPWTAIWSIHFHLIPVTVPQA